MSKVGGILLAAGSSTRMQGECKQLLPVSGEPLARRCAQVLLQGGLSPLLVVIPPGSDALSAAFAGLPVFMVENQKHAEGMATSIVAGMKGLRGDTDGVAIALADMPNVRPGTVRKLVESFARTDRNIVYPVFRGRRGHPVIFNVGKYSGRLGRLVGDSGARTVISENPEDTFAVGVDDPGVIFDIDTPGDFENYLMKRSTDEKVSR